MKIGLCGAQGTGKTTLAKAYSEVSGIPYIDAKVGDFLNEIDVDLSRSDMPIVERMKAQLMVAGHIASITEAPDLLKTGFIIDRTPIDVMAYTPHIAEWLSTIGVIAAAVLAWLLAVRYLTVFEPKAHAHKQTKKKPVATTIAS